MAGFLTSNTASIPTGSEVVSLTGGVNCSFVVSGTAVFINGSLFEGVSGTSPDISGNSTITLRGAYTGTSIVNGTLVAFNTIEGLRDAIQRARDLSAVQESNNLQLESFLTSTLTSVDLELPSGTIAVTPYQYLLGIVLANDVKQYAVTQAQFEAIRAQNNERYAASGFVHFGNHESDKQVNETKSGLYTSLTTPNTLLIGKAGGVGGSKTDNAASNIAGVITHLPAEFKIKFPQAPDGKTTYNKATGAGVLHADSATAFAAVTADIEVVTDRVDMWGFESYLEEVSVSNPYVYPNGLIQSQATTMDGIATSASNRPITYYAVFDGDTSSKGKGLNFYTLTDAQKRKVLGNYKNSLYYSDDGRLLQWRLRQRTIAGKGNGDWGVLSPVSGSQNDGLQWGGFKYISAQGSINVAEQYASVNASIYLQQLHPESRKQLGVFSTDYNSPNAANGECYFLVCGTVNRLNQGAYHPSFNPSGTREINQTAGNGGARWYSSIAYQVSNTAACFDIKTYSSSSGATLETGSIATARSGYPSGRFYDAIYASGQGGVCRDTRYSANCLTSIDFSNADQQIKNGKYRGFEKLKFTRVVFANISGVGDFASGFYSRVNFPLGTLAGVAGGGNTYPFKDAWLVNSVDLLVYRVDTVHPSEVGADRVYITTYSGQIPAVPLANAQGPWSLVLSEVKSTSVGGAFLQADIFGNPVNIAITTGLDSGWEGGWGGLISSGLNRYSLNRKAISLSSDYLFTSNNGVSWVSGTPSNGLGGGQLDEVTNTIGVDLIDSSVFILPYQAFAKQTGNAGIGVVYGGSDSLGCVFATDWHGTAYGSILVESLIGKVPTNNSTTAGLLVSQSLSVTDSGVIRNSRWDGDALYSYPSHTPLKGTTPPQNSSVGVKAMDYNSVINKQGFIQYAYTELKHNGTSWGDGGRVRIVDNQVAETDLNGQTVLVGTARLKEPIGWCVLKV